MNQVEYVTCTIDNTALNKIINEILSQLNKQKLSIEEVQLSNKCDELDTKIQELREEINAKQAVQANSIENIRSKIISVEEKALSDTNAVKTLAIQRLDEQNNRSNKSLEKLQTDTKNLLKEHKETVVKIMDTIDQNHKMLTERMDSLRLSQSRLPPELADPSPSSHNHQGGDEQEIIKIREQIHYLHTLLTNEKEERIQMYNSIDKKSISTNYEEICADISTRLDVLEERHNVDIQTLMKTLEEKFKVRVRLEEQPVSPERSHLVKELYAQVAGLKKEIEDKVKPPEKKLEVQSEKPTAKSEEIKKEPKVISDPPIPHKETQKVSNANPNKDLIDKIEMLEHTLKIGLNSISTKADKSQLDSVQQSVNIMRVDINKLQAAFKSIEDFKKSTEQALLFITGESSELKEGIASLEKKQKKTEDTVTMLEFKSKEHDESINKKADILEMKLLKDIINQSNNTIDRLCRILENVNVDEQLLDDQNGKGINLKVLYFKMHEKLLNMEKEMEKMNNALKSTEEEVKEPQKATVVHDHNNDTKLTKLESAMNDLRAELDDLKTSSLKLHESSISDLRRSIDSLGGDMKKLYEDLINQIQEKMRFVINRDMLETYQGSLKLSLDKMDKKLERIEMNKQTLFLRKKIQALEDKIALKKPKESADEIPMMMCNYKCFFCARDVNLTPENVTSVNKKMSKRYSFKSFNPPSTTLYGPGFSRILEAIRTHPELETEIFSKNTTTQMGPATLSTDSIGSPKANKTSMSKRTNSKLSPLSFKN